MTKERRQEYWSPEVCTGHQNVPVQGKKLWRMAWSSQVWDETHLILVPRSSSVRHLLEEQELLVADRP